MATHAELALFTHGELEEMQLMHRDLATMSGQQLLLRAKQLLERFKDLPDETPIPDDVSIKINEIYQSQKLDLSGVAVPENGIWNKILIEKLLDKLFDLGIGLLIAWIAFKLGLY